MNSPMHSKAPWTASVLTDRDGYLVVSIGSCDGGLIAEVFGGRKRQNLPPMPCPNGYLILAAPDLLAACKLLVESLSENPPKKDRPARDLRVQRGWEAALAALEKAEPGKHLTSKG